ncbi:MAG: hypothetical protein AAGA93_16580 [Actinomycetota bacterium]
MSPLVVGGIVAAVVAVALALQVLARQIQRLPLDQRRTDPLIDVSFRATGSMRPSELHQLTTIVGNAVLSDAAYRSELSPLLDRLGAPPDDEPGRRAGARTRRSDRIETAIARLEARWELGDPGGRDG